MAYFAQLDTSTPAVVQQVIVIDDAIAAMGERAAAQWIVETLHLPGEWIETSEALHHKHAGVGHEFHRELKALVVPRHNPDFLSWRVNPLTKEYEAPVPHNRDPVIDKFNRINWDEPTQTWRRVRFSPELIRQIQDRQK